MLRAEKRSAHTQRHDCYGSGENGEVARIATGLERGRSLKVAVKEKRIVLDFCFFFAELAVRLVQSSGCREVQELMDVMCDAPFDGKSYFGTYKKLKTASA